MWWGGASSAAPVVSEAPSEAEAPAPPAGAPAAAGRVGPGGKRTAVVCVVGLTPRLLGADTTPRLSAWLAGASGARRARHPRLAAVRPAFPAVTCVGHAAYTTGRPVCGHGVVANGWAQRDEGCWGNWRQADRTVRGPKVWETLRAKVGAGFTVHRLFWWFNMWSAADVSVTPRPQYFSDGRKAADIYTQPPGLRDALQEELGGFPLFRFWGPFTSVASSRWIADAAKLLEARHAPSLQFVYLPHLDYVLQKEGPDPGNQLVRRDLREIDALAGDLVDFYEARGVEVVVVSEYGITPVSRPVHINVCLRRRGYLTVRTELGGETLDPGASRAWACADHQVAHVYVRAPEDVEGVRRLLEGLAGVGEVLDAAEQRRRGLWVPDRSGDLLAVADADSWFTYYYWLDPRGWPDFAECVNIHRKPGYDPCEMLLNTPRWAAVAKAAAFVLLNRLGFRASLRLTPTDAAAERIKGSHGRVPEQRADWPVCITRAAHLLPAAGEELPAERVHDLIAELVCPGGEANKVKG